MKKMRISTIAIIVLSTLSVLCLLLSLIISSSTTSSAFSKVKDEAASVCESFSFEDSRISVTRGPNEETSYSSYKVYYLNVSITADTLPGNYRIKRFLSALDDIDIDKEMSILMTNVHINGDAYWYSSIDGSLYRNREELSGT